MNPNHALIFDLIDGLRERGITSYKGTFGGLGTVELTFGDLPIKSETENARSPLTEAADTSTVGADGLTAEQQADFYGRVIDAPRD